MENFGFKRDGIDFRGSPSYRKQSLFGFPKSPSVWLGNELRGPHLTYVNACPVRKPRPRISHYYFERITQTGITLSSHNICLVRKHD